MNRIIGGKHTIYFDSACMALKPRQVAEAINYYYTSLGACGGAGRSNHSLGREVSDLIDDSRVKVADFLNANQVEEVLFTRNTTEAVNIVANGVQMGKGDNVVSTTLEHHSGILPFWRQKEKRGVDLRLVRADREGLLPIEEFEKQIDDNTKVVSVVHSSNVTGTIAPLKEIVKIAHDHGALVFSDEAQYTPHHKFDVRKFGVDFAATSVHKMLGPTGQGILWGRYDLLAEMDPFLVGGDTIMDVVYDGKEITPEFLPPPHRFEAGLQDYAGMIGTGAAIDYLNHIGMDNIEAREKQLTRRLMRIVNQFEGKDIDIIGPKDHRKRAALVSFHIKNVAVRDAVVYFDDMIPNYRLMVRAGAHCVNPFHYSIGLDPSKGEGTIRVSLYLYNEMWELGVLKDQLTRFLEAAR